MFKGRELIGKSIVSYDAGEKFEVVKDLIFDQESNQLLGFLVQEAGWFKRAQVLLLSDVQAIGVDAVITSSKGAIVNAHNLPAVGPILDHNTVLKGTRILTMDGRDLGVIVDLYVDEANGKVEGYEVSGGLFADAYSGRSFVPAIETLKIGRDVAFVPVQTAQLMEEQIGGLRGAMQTVGDQLQETAQVTGEQLHDLGQSASHQFHETAQATGERLHEWGQTASDTWQETTQVTGEQLNNLGQTASDKWQETTQITGEQFHDLDRYTAASITNAMVDPAAQKAFVIGQTAQQDVMAPGGESLVLAGQPVTQAIVAAAEALGILDQLYRATGGRRLAPWKARLGDAIAGFGVEQTEGRRVQHLVRSEEGSIIAAPGQIVTPEVIERAKATHRERLLLQAVGLSAGEALQSRSSSAITLAVDHLQGTSQTTGEHLHRAGEQMQVGAKGLWSQVKETASAVQSRSTQAFEDKRIKGALGRPVTRVILGQQDEVILNVGELITHQAIASARQAQVLDLLLNSVYTDKPQISLENLRAPQVGTAAL